MVWYDAVVGVDLGEIHPAALPAGQAAVVHSTRRLRAVRQGSAKRRRAPGQPGAAHQWVAALEAAPAAPAWAECHMAGRVGLGGPDQS